jgi:hypothetical protein
VLEWSMDPRGDLVGATPAQIVRLECSRCHSMRLTRDYPHPLGSPQVCNGCRGSAPPHSEATERVNAVEVARHTTGGPLRAFSPPPRRPFNASPTRPPRAHAVETPQTDPNRPSTVPNASKKTHFRPTERFLGRPTSSTECKTPTTGDEPNEECDTI